MENSSRDGNTRAPDLPPENLYAGQEATELNMEQQTGSKLRKEYVKAVYCHPAYLTYLQSIMQNAGLDEVQAEIRIDRKISITSDIKMIPPLQQKAKRN